MRDYINLLESNDKPSDPNLTRAERAEHALRQIAQMLEDWPTMRALSALGAERATGYKNQAKQIIADVLGADIG